MSMDPQQPYQPQYAPAPTPTQGQWGTSTIGNLGAEVMAGIAYLLSLLSFVGFIGQIIIFAMEKNRFAKFHAAQAMLLGLVEAILFGLYFFVMLPLNIAASSAVDSGSAAAGAAAAGSLGVAAIGGCVLSLVGLALFGFWIWGMISAFTGKATKLPIIGGIAEGLAGGPVSAI